MVRFAIRADILGPWVDFVIRSLGKLIFSSPYPSLRLGDAGASAVLEATSATSQIPSHKGTHPKCSAVT